MRNKFWQVLVILLMVGWGVVIIGCAETLFENEEASQTETEQLQQGNTPISPEDFMTQQRQMMQQRMLQERPLLIGPGSR